MPARHGGSDVTERALRAWLAALPAERYDVRLVPSLPGGNDGALRRAAAPDGFLRLLPLLRARNAAGSHVYARPAHAGHLLVDDVDQDGLDAMRADGHRPAAVIETSPANLQVWLRLTAHGTEPDHRVASAAARVMAARYGGDPGAASSAQLGRVPGFTNRKPLHERRDGSYPFVLLREARGGVDPCGSALLDEATQVVADEPHRQRFVSKRRADRRRALRAASPTAEYAEAAVRVAATAGPHCDRSRVDFAAAVRLLRRGASEAYVAEVLAESGHAKERGPGGWAYVERTIAAASARVAEGLITAGGAGERKGKAGAEL